MRLRGFFCAFWNWVTGRRLTGAMERHRRASERLDAAVKEMLKQ